MMVVPGGVAPRMMPRLLQQTIPHLPADDMVGIGNISSNSRFERLGFLAAEQQRARMIEALCGSLNIKDCRVKSETQLQLHQFKTSDSNRLMLPENRALLLDYLQSEC